MLDLVNSSLFVEDEVVFRFFEVCIVSCEYDFFRDYSLLYKKRLEDLRVLVIWYYMEDGFYGVFVIFDMGFLFFFCFSRIMNVVVYFLKGL